MAYNGIERRKKSRKAESTGRLSWANAHRLADDCALDLMALDSDVIQAMREGKPASHWLKGKPQ